MKIDFDENFDVIIIGGGALGSSLALDSASRGLKTILIEENDFSSASSSKSTKLLHGGVRYLEKVVNTLDRKQFSLVYEALNERYNFLKNANHLAHKIKILSPIKKWYELPYYYVGLKLYDFFSKEKTLGSTSYKNKKTLQKQIPSINKKTIKSAVEFYDGSFNDSKLAINILQSAQIYGAIVKNYTKFEAFIYKETKLVGIKAYDKFKEKELFFKASCIINATGKDVDRLRKLDDEMAEEITTFSKGTHLVISKKLLNIKEGVIIPQTKDGRVLFILPWLDYCLIGTTDKEVSVSESLKASKEEKEYLLEHINEYFDKKILFSDILSSWSGLRVLIKNNDDSKDVVREHIIDISKNNLISICGGKWTTARKIAQECLDFAIEKSLINTDLESFTQDIKLFGSYENKQNLKEEIAKYGFSSLANKHLLETYGINALKVLKLSKEKEEKSKILENYAYLKIEVFYCLEYEFIRKPMDFLARRIRLAFLDKKACKNAVESVSRIIQEYYSYDEKTYESLVLEAQKELDEFF